MKTQTVSVLALLAAAGQVSAAELFRDEMINGGGWGVNATADTQTTFGFNYGAQGIPEAPSSLGGDVPTAGLRLAANIVTPAEAALMSLYPLGQNFTGQYRLRFDAWMNYDVNERINGGAIGTTEFLGGGVGYDNASTDLGPGAQLIATGEGGSGSDWRAFDEGLFLPTEAMKAGSRNGFVPYYADFLPGVVPPGGQAQDAFIPGVAGSPGFQWITFEFNVTGSEVTVNIIKPGGDVLPIVDIPTDSSGTDGNIMLFYADFFSSVSPAPDLMFGLIDNVVVTDVIPEPASVALLGMGGLALLRRR
ncbi:PEP-CTERM sorting domain-containing protein [Mucisphaera sp.]|uniref:PEP-CTERM sorting domain-containing protein n=1 Tax=Mucisphaera sp. TaxID=2913024 RepID=UPI003D127B68